MDFRDKKAESHTASKGCCVKWYVSDEQKFYKTSSFRNGWDESTSELIVTDLLKNSPFPFVSYNPCVIKFIYRNEERTEQGVWCNSFLKEGEHYIDMFSVLENKKTVKQFNDVMNVKERYNYTVDVLSNCVGSDVKPFINFMMSMDFVIGNSDRHCGNFGIIKQVDGTYRLAPIFDNGLSLWAQGRIPGDESDPFSSMARRQINFTKSKLFLDYITAFRLSDILEKYAEHINIGELEKFMQARIKHLNELFTPA